MHHVTRRLQLRPLAVSVALAMFATMWMIPTAAANHGNQRLEVTPEVESASQGTRHSLTATLYQGSTATVGGANNSSGPVVVDFAIESGPNQGETYSCT